MYPVLLVLTATWSHAALDTPHTMNSSIGCLSCHEMTSTEPKLIPPMGRSPEDIDDTLFNNLCWSCHNDSSIAPFVQTHSSLQTDNDYGDWTVECWVCHNQHLQEQFRSYGIASYVYTGISQSITASTISVAGSPWTENQYVGYVVVPNTARPNYNYQISGNTADTLTVAGAMDLAQVTAGAPLGIAYGKLIRKSINLAAISGASPAKTGSKAVKFFAPTGANSFADGGGVFDGICEVCHTRTDHFKNDGTGGDQLHANMGLPAGQDCTRCHMHKNGFMGMGGGAHTTHVSGPILSLDCAECHSMSALPAFKDGTASKADTTVCDNCHTANGVALAKQFWEFPGSSARTPGSWAVVEGEAKYCGSCHDSTPGKTKSDGTGDTAYNVVGNGTIDNNYTNSAFGFYVTGHGKQGWQTEKYARLSYQDTSASGNPVADLQRCGQCHGLPPLDEYGWPNPPFPPTPPVTPCGFCHELQSAHFNSAAKRLRAGFENNQSNDNCKKCHSSDASEGTAATSEPHFYTTSSAYESSAHKDKLCTDCHDVHGSAGNFAGMTKGDKQNLCTQCHSDVGGHPGAGSAAFTHNGKNYTLQCVSCHNVHLVTGTYGQADQDKSPVTKFSDNLNVWGDTAEEKMNAYAGSGTYRTPTGESFTGSQLPDYASFCTDCHGQEGNPPFGINWNSDPHGKGAANQPNGYGTCPNWYTCGKAFGWDGDNCTGTESECWPVTPRGAGDQLFSREVYTHTDRVAGANFTLSCPDCHTGHGSGTLGRPNVNGGSFTSNWNSMCNNCHYYYSDWHAGMACGSASCHISNSIHRMDKNSGSGGTRTHAPGLVLSYAFENNLKDSGGWELDGKWYSASGSFAGGKSGQAAVLAQGQTVQVGTENSYWSTDEGYHGTWKYTEMKYNTTLETWVYPTDNAKSEYTIFTKHTGYNNGGYRLSLKKVGGTLRVAFNCQIDNNGFAQGGAAGVRGAYSSIAVPLNIWTHVAATFDTAGADRDPLDPSAGRIRIYVNGVDVTTSDASGNNMQPETGETSMYAYSENSPWNEAICYNGHWCASEFAIGGFDWESTNFIGMIDEAKVWNITRDAAYFAAYDQQAGPYISRVEGLIGSDRLTVRFSEGVYGSGGAPLGPGDFTLEDTNNDNPRIIDEVIHSAGSATATVVMGSVLTAADVDADTLAAVSGAIFDEHGNGALPVATPIGLSAQCPTSPVTIALNEPAGSSYAMDSQAILYGAVSSGLALTGAELSGDGVTTYIDFENNSGCLQADRKMTLEARIKPAGLAGTGNYIRRVLARDSGSANYQLSVWRNNGVTDEDPPADVAMIALWTKPQDAHGGADWKVTLTDFTICPVTSDKWYLVKAVWDSDIATGIPARIYVDDQGSDGSGFDESWAGYIDCTDSDQSQVAAAQELSVGDVITKADGDFTIGASVTNHASNVFDGLIDWITWKDAAN